MKYTLIQVVDGLVISTTLHPDNVIPAMEARGYEFVGLNSNPRQRQELQGAPKFRGVCGPMWNGDGVRYECPTAYSEFST